MKTIEVLTAELSEVFALLKSGEIETKNAEALANIAGKLIKGNLGQLQYYDQRKETPQLPFWEHTDKP